MDVNVFVGAFVGVLLGMFLIGLPAVLYEGHKYKSAAIERGYAQYSPTTGEWGWK